jgi:hypothetical protein
MDLLLGDSPAIRDLRVRIADAAHSDAKVVVITGESGIGDEVIAQLVNAENRGVNVIRVQIPTLRDRILERMLNGGESFWTAAYVPFLARDLTRDDLRSIVGAGLQMTRGSYKRLAERFNIPAGEYKRFLNFLRKHGCQLPFRQYRGVSTEVNDSSETG